MSLGIHLAGSSRAGLGIARTDAVVQNMGQRHRYGQVESMYSGTAGDSAVLLDLYSL